MSKQAFFISSDDLFLVDQAKNKLIAALKNKEEAEVVRISCYGNESIQDQLTELTIPDLFSPKKVLVLTAAEGKWHASTVKSVTALLDNLSQTPYLFIVIALCQFKAQQLKTKALQAIQKSCQVKIIATPKDNKLDQWIQTQAKSYKVSLSSEAIGYLKEHTQAHLYACDQLLQKCSLMGMSKISEKDLLNIMSDNSKYTIYDLMSAMAKGERQTLDIFNYLVSQKTAIVLILWNIINSLKMAYTASFNMKYLNMPRSEVLSKLWYQQKSDTEQFINRLTFQQINSCLQKTFSIDKLVKSKGEAETIMAIHEVLLAITKGSPICVH